MRTVEWGRGPKVFVPNEYADDGTISEEYLAYWEYEENRDTIEEERWEAERDEELSRWAN